jgi:hypothetical protein
LHCFRKGDKLILGFCEFQDIMRAIIKPGKEKERKNTDLKPSKLFFEF